MRQWLWFMIGWKVSVGFKRYTIESCGLDDLVAVPR